MPTNPIYNFTNSKTEQNLLAGLMEESISIYGQDMIYIPRVLNNLDPIYTEDAISSYEKMYTIPVYIKTVDGFTGDAQYMSNFGLEIRDQVIFTISKRVFHRIVTYFDETRNVPKEGDLIYYPVNGRLFQIKFVDYKPIFYQLGQLATYDLTCELFEYSSEIFITGNNDIDSVQTNFTADVREFGFITEDGKTLLTENGDVLLPESYEQNIQNPLANNDIFNDSANNYDGGTNDGTYDDTIFWTSENPFSEDQPY